MRRSRGKGGEEEEKGRRRTEEANNLLYLPSLHHVSCLHL
jgi:hypothetical protein